MSLSLHCMNPDSIRDAWTRLFGVSLFQVLTKRNYSYVNWVRSINWSLCFILHRSQFFISMNYSLSDSEVNFIKCMQCVAVICTQLRQRPALNYNVCITMTQTFSNNSYVIQYCFFDINLKYNIIDAVKICKHPLWIMLNFYSKKNWWFKTWFKLMSYLYCLTGPTDGLSYAL